MCRQFLWDNLLPSVKLQVRDRTHNTSFSLYNKTFVYSNKRNLKLKNYFQKLNNTKPQKRNMNTSLLNLCKNAKSNDGLGLNKKFLYI